jgi:Ca2+:H+ antiporter
VLAAVMITANGIVGLCLLAGGVRHHEQGFQVRGASAAPAVLSTLSVMTLVLHLTFVFVQTVRHRDHFLVEGGVDEGEHPPPPSTGAPLAVVGIVISMVVLLPESASAPCRGLMAPREAA